jgi:hypothetical protein
MPFLDRSSPLPRGQRLNVNVIPSKAELDPQLQEAVSYVSGVPTWIGEIAMDMVQTQTSHMTRSGIGKLDYRAIDAAHNPVVVDPGQFVRPRVAFSHRTQADPITKHLLKLLPVHAVAG